MIKEIIIYLILTLILVKLAFFVGKMYGYLMLLFMIFVVIPVWYFLKWYYFDDKGYDYMLHQQQLYEDYDINEYI